MQMYLNLNQIYERMADDGLPYGGGVWDSNKGTEIIPVRTGADTGLTGSEITRLGQCGLMPRPGDGHIHIFNFDFVDRGKR
jgi:hypothetical protein